MHVGIDVSKQFLDLALGPQGAVSRYPNDEQGCAAVLERLGQVEVDTVVLEATGGYEALAASTLASRQLKVAVVNPAQVRHFARSLGQRAKTDRIDAQVLALFGERVQPRLTPVKDETARELDEVLTRRRQLVVMLASEKRHLSTARASVRSGIEKHIAWLKAQLVDLEMGMHALICQSTAWKAKCDLLSSVPGVGTVLSMSLVAELPELGHLDRKAVAALVGVAPYSRDSGRKMGIRRIGGGRGRLRNVLYMATVAAIRCNPVLRAAYLALKERGKPAKVAIVACMRRLIVILNAIVRAQAPWRTVESVDCT